MSVRKSTAYRITMIVLSFVCLAGVGFIVYRTYFAQASADKLLAEARKSYAVGSAAETAKNPADASTAYAEAAIHADNGIVAVGKKVGNGDLSQDDGRAMLVDLWRIRARATRDREFAKAAADGKPLQEVLDTTTNERYRSYGILSDPKELGQSIADLRNAFDVNPADPESAKELLRLELTMSPLNWGEIAKVCKVLVEKTPNDPRLNYCLAREVFQQGGPRLSDKSAERVKEAEDYLKVAENNQSPYWRTVWLRLQILRWHAEMAKKTKDKDAAKRAEALHDKLFDPADGVLARAAAGEALVPLSAFDTEGLFGVHRLALAVLLADPAKPPATADVKAVCVTAVAMGTKLAASNSDTHLPEAGAVIADVTSQAAPVLSKASRPDWEAVSQSAREFFAAHPTAAVGTAAVRVAMLTAQEAFAARKRGDEAAAKELRDQALTALETGLKAATDQKRVADQLEFRLALLEVKWSDGTKVEEIEPQVTALRALASPVANGVADFYDAHLAMRRGQLEKAKRYFEAVSRDKSVPGFALRSHIALAELSLTLAQPADATFHLQQVADAYARFNEKPAADRQALESRFAGPDEVTALQVVATLGAGLQRLARETRENPGQQLPNELKESILRPVRGLMKTLRVPVDKDRPSPDRTARLTLAQFLIPVGDRAEAGTVLDTLAVDYPRSPEVLRARVAFRLMPPAGASEPAADARDQADEMIQRFTRENADVRAGKLFWAEWLIRTGRGEKAEQYLTNPVNFADQNDPVLERLRAGALFQSGDREGAMKLLGALPADPTIDWVLLQAAASRDNRDALLKSALGRYENNGLFRVYEAATKLADKKFEEATTELLGVVEYTALRQTARALLERTFVAYVDHDLKAATAYLGKLVADHPDEPVVFAGFAFAALQNEEVGDPTDAWPAKRTMYAAVNKWEQLSLERPGKPGIAPLAAGLTRMRFHQFAGKPVLARQEGVRLLAQDKGNLDLLLQLTELYLIDPVPQPAEAQKYLDAAFETVPKDSVPLLRLKAVVKERMGDPAGAAAVYEQMTVLFPTDSTGYGNLVRLATAQGKPEDATRWAVKWSEKQPENDLAVLELIRQYSVTGAKPAAKSEAESLVKKVAERAKKAAEKAPADPKNPVEKQVAAARTAAHRLIASAFKQAKAFDEADAHIQAALAATPGDLATRMIAGEVAIAKEDWDAAVKVYKGIVAEDATNGVAGNNLAWVLATKKDQPAEALALVEKARTREGASKPIGAERLSPAFLDTIGVVYAKQSNKEKLTEMRDIFETAVRRFPSDPRMHFWLAEAYTALGENAKATARYEVAATLCEKTVVGLPDEERTKLRDQIAAKTKKRN